MGEHTVKAYDQELQELRGKISDIGRMSRFQLDTVLEAFTQKDMSSARRIIAGDSAIDRLEHEVNQLTVHMLAARQPMAVDLRTIISALKIATDMERVADYVVNIAKQVLALQNSSMLPSLHDSTMAMKCAMNIRHSAAASPKSMLLTSPLNTVVRSC